MKALKILIIDDLEERHESLSQEYKGNDLHHAYRYDEAIKFLNTNQYDFITFDHDLEDFKDGVERTGLTIAKYMVENEMKAGRVRVHSHNMNGAKNIISVIKSGNVSDVALYRAFTVFKNF